MNAFCASENFEAFIVLRSSSQRMLPRKTPLLNGPVFGDQSRSAQSWLPGQHFQLANDLGLGRRRASAEHVVQFNLGPFKVWIGSELHDCAQLPDDHRRSVVGVQGKVAVIRAHGRRHLSGPHRMFDQCFSPRLPLMTAGAFQIGNGPFRQRDINGLDTHLNIARYLYEDLAADRHPPAILERMVEERRLGRKAGAGCYDWPAAPADSDRRALEAVIAIARAARRLRTGRISRRGVSPKR